MTPKGTADRFSTAGVTPGTLSGGAVCYVGRP